MHIKTVGSYEAKTHFSAILDSVVDGEKVIITRNGTPVAVLSPYTEIKGSLDDTIAALLELRKKHSLDGLNITDMKNDGRRY